MKKRNPLVVFILSIITFGIYDLYWLVVTKTELNAKTKVHTPTIWLLFAPMILIVLGVIATVTMGHSTTITSTTYSNGFNSTSTSTLPALALLTYVVAAIGFAIVSFFWFFKYSKAVNEYTNGKMNTGLTFVLLWMLHLIGVAIVQDAYNDHLEMATSPTAPPTPPTAMPDNQPVMPSSETPMAPPPSPTAEPMADQPPAEQPPAMPEAGSTSDSQDSTSQDQSTPS